VLGFRAKSVKISVVSVISGKILIFPIPAIPRDHGDSGN
jgi:hypothetical protein